MKNDVTKKSIIINRPMCKGCSICVAFCPVGALSMDGDGKAVLSKPDKCIRCGLCEKRCPDLAIFLREDDDDEKG
jgi:2-oxoglutarate ferredoxin oxidoreductase subunit delta